jgi:hypothetical protein
LKTRFGPYLVTDKVENKLDIGFLSHLLLPARQVVLVPREAVDEKVVLLRIDHGAFEQGTRDLDGHDGAVGDVVLDELAELGVGPGTLGSQQIA